VCCFERMSDGRSKLSGFEVHLVDENIEQQDYTFKK
jgi:hypothetical protein